MNGQPTNDESVNRSDRPGAEEELQGDLRIAVERIRSVPRPAELGSQLLCRAAQWEREAPVNARRRPIWKLAAAVAAVAAAALLVASLIGPRLGPQTLSPVPLAIGPRAEMTAQYVFVPPVIVASRAPVLIIACGDGPQKLGAHGSYNRLSEAIQLWNWGESEMSRQLETSVSGALAVSPDGKWIVTADGRRIDAATGKADPTPCADFPRGDVRALSFSPDGRRLAVSVYIGTDQATVYVIDFPSGARRCSIPGQWPYALRPQVAAFTADGRQLVLMDKGKFIRRWDTETGKELLKYEPAHSNSLMAIAVSPDGKLLASADGEGHNYLWELKSGKLLHRLVARQTPDHESLRVVCSLAFSPDGKRLAGGALQNLVVWQTSSGQIDHVFPSSSGGAAHIRFSRDGKSLTTVHEAHLARLKADSDRETFVWPTVCQWTLD